MAVSAIANPSQEPTYLQRLTQKLDPEQIAQEENTASYLLTTAKVLGVSSLLLGLGGIAAALFLPVFTVPIMLTTAALFFSTGIGGAVLGTVADGKQEKIDERKKINTYQANFPTPASIQAFLTHMGITWNQIPGIGRLDDLMKLKPLAALYKHKEAKTKELTRQCDEKLNEIDATQKIIEEDSFAIGARFTLLNAEQDLRDALAKTLNGVSKLAFINALFRRPDFVGTRKQVVEVEESSYINLKYISHNPQGPLLIFKNRNVAPITVQEFRQMSHGQIGQRLATAMA